MLLHRRPQASAVQHRRRPRARRKACIAGASS
jgi:hypothetical protein